MNLAFEKANKNLGSTKNNPSVGCVVVKAKRHVNSRAVCVDVASRRDLVQIGFEQGIFRAFEEFSRRGVDFEYVLSLQGSFHSRQSLFQNGLRVFFAKHVEPHQTNHHQTQDHVEQCGEVGGGFGLLLFRLGLGPMRHP